VKSLNDVTIIISSPPYGVEQPWNALRLALALIAVSGESNVNIFIVGDAISMAKKGQNTPQGYYNLEKMLTDLIGKGANVRVCGTCLKSRGLGKEDLVGGVEVGSMIGLAEWVRDSRTTLSF
jgi:uncharacterized protein involved in oxidation of intracellular sulfur